jgi:hypothetical protein
MHNNIIRSWLMLFTLVCNPFLKLAEKLRNTSVRWKCDNIEFLWTIHSSINVTRNAHRIDWKVIHNISSKIYGKLLRNSVLYVYPYFYQLLCNASVLLAIQFDSIRFNSIQFHKKKANLEEIFSFSWIVGSDKDCKNWF